MIGDACRRYPRRTSDGYLLCKGLLERERKTRKTFSDWLDGEFSPILASPAWSLDHSVGPHQHVRRNRKSDLLRGFQIDDELEFLRLLHRKLSRLSAFEDLVHISSGAPVEVGEAHAVAHKPPGFHKIRPPVCRREPALYREVCNLRSVSIWFPSARTASARPWTARRNAGSISLGLNTSKY
jgi:hypothetical protein